MSETRTIIEAGRKIGAKIYHAEPLRLYRGGELYFFKEGPGISSINLVWPGKYVALGAHKWQETEPETYIKNPPIKGGKALFYFSQKVKPAATDGNNIYINPDAWRNFDIPTRYFIACHEIAHINGLGNEDAPDVRELLCDKYAAHWYLFRGLPPSLLVYSLEAILTPHADNQKRKEQMFELVKPFLK
jgi:hypothetical protein